MKERMLLKKLTDHGLTVKIVGDRIRISPLKLINDNVLTYVRTHKNDLLCALQEDHLPRRRALKQGRIQVLRVILKHYIKPSNPSRLTPTDLEVEEYIDWVLIQHDFDLEDAITTYRNIASNPAMTCKCSYSAPFCSCGGTAIARMASCNQCRYFTPDAIGTGAGIGNCNLGVVWTQELHGRMPLYKYAVRHCDKFNSVMIV